MQQIERAGDRRCPIEWRPSPRRRELAPLGERPSGLAEPIDRSIAVAAAKRWRTGSSQGAAESFRWPGEGLLQPGLKGARVQMIGLWLRQDGEERVDAGLDRALADELGAKAVNRVDVRFFEALERVVETFLCRRIAGLSTPDFERLPQAQLQLARGLFSERDGHYLLDAVRTGFEHAQNPVHQLGRLAGAGRGFDHERVVQVVADRRSCLRIRIGLRVRDRHRMDLRFSRSASLSGALLATRSSSRGPQTGLKSHHLHTPLSGAATRNPDSTARSMIASAWSP